MTDRGCRRASWLRLVLIAILALAAVPGAHAQRYDFRTFTQSDGLTDLTITSFLQDRTGFLWIGTNNGLFRYDGHRFRRFGVESGLSSASVRSLVETDDGALWVGSLSAVSRRSGDRFVRESPSGLFPSLGSQTLARDPFGSGIYVASGNGLVSLSATGRKTTIAPSAGRPVWSVFTEPGKGVWYASNDEVCLWNGTGSRCYGSQTGPQSSQPDKGSTFYFEIPISSGEVAMAIPKMERRVIGLQAAEPPRVLVVDDEPNNRGWLTSLLQTVGFAVHEAEDGEEAVRRWQELRPQLILMDMRMPVTNGMEATRRIRALGGQETIILALTASALEEHRQEAMESGVDDFLSKPCGERELFRKIQQYLGIDLLIEEESAPETDHVGAARLAADADVCRKLPVELIVELQQAVSNGEKDVLDEMIGRVAVLDAPAASSMRQLADNYDYDALTHLLEEVRA